jgi:hypothetical protein
MLPEMRHHSIQAVQQFPPYLLPVRKDLGSDDGQRVMLWW